MGTKNFSNANDLITFSRASGGTALRKIAYGPELVTNGTFDSDSDWTKGTGWSISGGVAVSNNASGFTDIKQSVAVTPNKIYRLDFSVASYTSGSVMPYLGNNGSVDANPYDQGNLTNALTATSVGEFYAFFVFDASQPGQIVFRSNGGFIGTIDNISVKEVLFDDASGDLTLFNHPADIPRIEYDADGNVLGLLVEESRTNSVLKSNEPTASPWSAGTTATQNLIGPDGSPNSGWTLEDVSTSQFQQNSQAVTIPANTDTHCVSFFIKKDGDESRFPEFHVIMSANNFFLQLNTKTGATYTRTNQLSGVSSVEDYGAWWRVIMTATNVSSGTTLLFKMIPAVSATMGNAVSSTTTGSIGFYGAQIELSAAFPTSYIPTAGATATRSDDQAIIPVAEIPLNVGAGTFVAEFDFVDPENDVNNYVAGGLSNARIIYNNAGNSLWQTYDGNAAITFGNLDNTGASFFKAAVGVKTGKDAVTFLDGTFKGSSASATDLMTNLAGTDIALGGASTNQKLNGHIKSINYYPRRLTNAQLEALTAPLSGETLFLTFDGLESSFTEKSIHG